MPDRVNVPCGGCRLCCRSFMVPIQPDKGDDPSQYQTAICYSPDAAPYMILDRHPNGDCIYLGPAGCTIHDRAPYHCRAFDCRDYFKSYTRNERRDLAKRDTAAGPMFDRGRELLQWPSR
jgi:Fe-S-cluster containining protein